MSDKDIKDSINNYYENLTYTQEYMYDIWITIIIFLIVLIFVMYFYIKNTILSQKTTWNINKCNPLYMPFASLINPDITDPPPIQVLSPSRQRGGAIHKNCVQLPKDWLLPMSLPAVVQPPAFLQLP